MKSEKRIKQEQWAIMQLQKWGMSDTRKNAKRLLKNMKKLRFSKPMEKESL